MLTKVGWSRWLSICGQVSLLSFPPELSLQQLLVPFYWVAGGPQGELPAVGGARSGGLQPSTRWRGASSRRGPGRSLLRCTFLQEANEDGAVPCSLALQSLSVSTTKLPLPWSLNPWGPGIEGPPNKWNESHSFLRMSPRFPEGHRHPSIISSPRPPPRTTEGFEAHFSVRGGGDMAPAAPSAIWNILTGLRLWETAGCFHCPPPAPPPLSGPAPVPAPWPTG